LGLAGWVGECEERPFTAVKPEAAELLDSTTFAVKPDIPDTNGSLDLSLWANSPPFNNCSWTTDGIARFGDPRPPKAANSAFETEILHAFKSPLGSGLQPLRVV
jgi:hypothetical protein